MSAISTQAKAMLMLINERLNNTLIDIIDADARGLVEGNKGDRKAFRKRFNSRRAWNGFDDLLDNSIDAALKLSQMLKDDTDDKESRSEKLERFKKILEEAGV